MHGTRRATRVALLALAGVLLAGCQHGGKSDVRVVPQQSSSFAAGNKIGLKQPKEILQAAEAAFRSARSARVRNSDDSTPPHVIFDMVMTRDGAKGRMVENGVQVEVIRVRKDVYLRGRVYWTKLDAYLGKAIGDKWAKVSETDALAYYSQAPTTGEFAERMLAVATSGPKLPFESKTMVTTAVGPAVRLRSAGSSFEVAATGQPYPLRYQYEGGAATYLFSEYNRVAAITAPKGAVDLSKPLTIPAQG